MDPKVVGTEATRKGGVACDFILISVEEGRIEAWEEAARMWSSSRFERTSVRIRGNGVLAVLVPRPNPHQVMNTDLVLEGITEQFRRNSTDPNPPKKARV